MSNAQAREDKLLGAAMAHLVRGKPSVSFQQLAKDLGFMDRTTSYRNSWRNLIENKGFLEPVQAGAAVFTTDHQLTEAGKAYASTPEYEEYLKELNFSPQSNEEHQERIKKKLLNTKAVQIFDLLLKYGALTRKDLAILMHCNDRGHAFSYGLRDLRDKNLIEKDGNGKKNRLADKAFLDPNHDRPEPETLDASLLEEGETSIESKKRRHKTENKTEDASKENEAGDTPETKKKKNKVSSVAPQEALEDGSAVCSS